MLDAFFVTLIGVVAVQALPGPNLVAVASASLGKGRHAGLLTTLGISTGMLFWAVAVAFGLGALFTTYPLSLVLLKFGGGGYLLWLAFRAWRAAYRGGGATIRPDRTQRSPYSDWKHGLLVVLTNPKAALMWAAVATFLFGAGLATWQVALFGPVVATTGLLIYGSYAMLFSTQRMESAYRRLARGIEAAFGTVFGAFGAKLILDGSRALRE